MRSANTTTVPVGRHRFGRPGGVPVTELVTVVRRGFFASMFGAGRHLATPTGPPPALHQLRGHATV